MTFLEFCDAHFLGLSIVILGLAACAVEILTDK